MPDYTIRRAAPGDGQGLAEIWLDAAEWRSTYAEAQTPDQAGLAEWMESEALADMEAGKGVTLVAEAGGQVVGFANVMLRAPDPTSNRQVVPELGSPVISIDSIVLRKGHRRKGLGGKLLDAAEDWGRQQGAAFASALQTATNPILPFWAKQGYHVQSVRYRKRLQ
jgi:GNAT superfamily N-acetyltransferase